MCSWKQRAVRLNDIMYHPSVHNGRFCSLSSPISTNQRAGSSHSGEVYKLKHTWPSKSKEQFGCTGLYPKQCFFTLSKWLFAPRSWDFLPRVETRGIIEAIDSESVTETKSMLNSQRKSIWTFSTSIIERFDLRMTCRCTDKCNVLF